MSGGILCFHFPVLLKTFPAIHRAKKFFDKDFSLVQSKLLPAKSGFANTCGFCFLKCNDSSDISNHSFLFFSLPLSHTRTPRKSQNLKTENSLVLAFCGAFHSEQVRSEFGQKVSLKSLAYAIRHAPRHDIENVRSKRG